MCRIYSTAAPHTTIWAMSGVLTTGVPRSSETATPPETTVRPRHSPTVGTWGGAVAYEPGIPVWYLPVSVMACGSPHYLAQSRATFFFGGPGFALDLAGILRDCGTNQRLRNKRFGLAVRAAGDQHGPVPVVRTSNSTFRELDIQDPFRCRARKGPLKIFKNFHLETEPPGPESGLGFANPCRFV